MLMRPSNLSGPEKMLHYLSFVSSVYVRFAGISCPEKK